MKQYLNTAKRFLLIFTPLVTSSVLVSSPSHAATFSLSNSQLKITNLSQTFSPTLLNQADILGISQGETAKVELNNINVINEINIPNRELFTSAVSVALGESKDYLGLANTNAKLWINFDVDGGENLSFDFTADLQLATTIDESPVENASTSGSLKFFLLDTTAIPKANIPTFLEGLFSNNNIPEQTLESFFLSGSLNTLGNNDSLDIQNSNNVIYTSVPSSRLVNGGTLELATASVAGSVNRSFESKSNVTLFVSRKTQVTVKAPEPSTSLALILLAGLVAVATRNK